MMITRNQTKIKTVLTLAAAMATLGLTTTATQAAIVIYEPFDYPTGTIDGSQSGGTGMTGGWTTSGDTNFQSVITPGLTFSGLSTTGNAVRRADRQGNSEMNRGISAASQTALTADGSTICFSLLLDTETSYPKGNNLTFLFGTGAIADPSKTTPTITGGEGFGVSFLLNTPVSNQATLTALTVDDGTSSRSTGSIGPFTGNDLLFIVGKIDWAANGSNDTLSVYNIVDPAAALPAPFATMTADLDQSQFDTLAVGDKQRGVVDEIRFGQTFDDVMGIADPNAPDVDAGVDMITLSGMDVAMAPVVVNNDPNVPQRPLSHTWTTDAPVGYTVEWDPSNTVEAPTVTITQDTPGNPQTVTLTLKVDLDGTSATASDTMEIDVYNDACLAAKAVGPVELDPTDFDENCTTDLRDYALLAAKWLVDYALTAPIPKP